MISGIEIVRLFGKWENMDAKELQQIAKDTLTLEASTLEGLSSSIGKEFSDVVESIAGGPGRVVITGIGKSALIAQKIAATLNSTGTPALFMHAGDAIHGDMGMIQENDHIICISKSGESPEIRVLIPFLRNLGNRIIGMVSNKESFLGQNADMLLWTPVDKEADPNNLAPTSSTTAQMAMGDALAVALLALKGFTPKDFAKYHPGGALGKQLFLTVGDVSRSNPQPSVSPDASIRKIIMEISSKRMGGTAVTDRAGKILGIVTDGDLRRMLESAEDVSAYTAQQIMTANPKQVTAETMAIEALNLMREFSISQLLVASDGEYAGMIHLHDLIKEGLI